jgi:hypothetical protein
MQTSFKAECLILGELTADTKTDVFEFKAIIDKLSINVQLTISKKQIIASCETDISGELFNILEQNVNRKEPLEKELSSINTALISSINSVLSLMKYSFGQVKLDEELFLPNGVFWSKDKSKWNPILQARTLTLDVQIECPLDTSTSQIIQYYLQNNFTPFYALRHLHKAKREKNARYKWIDATIAAELAIKEFLIRLKPELAILLLEMPSPPLHKLYGSVLESFTKERSPRLSELNKGAETRNKLLHRPNEMVVTDGDANKYVHDVETAIWHLLTLLYPKDDFIKSRYIESSSVFNEIMSQIKVERVP